MKQYVSFIDGLPLILKVILALPALDNIVYGLYRIGKGNLLGGILCIIIGFPIFFAIDMFTLITKGKITVLV
ncbi:MAG: hypothetical protein V1761_01650 [bacterium]